MDEIEKVIATGNYEMIARTIAAIKDDIQFVEAMSMVPVEKMFSVSRAEPTIIPRVERLMKENIPEAGDDNRFERTYDPE